MLKKLVLFVLLMVTSYGHPLSIITNNAGNIKYDENNNWKGQTGSYKGFCTFSDKRYGLRAMALVIKANIEVTSTVEEFVLRYASEPDETIHSENIRNYARAIRKHLGKDFIVQQDIALLMPIMVELEGAQLAKEYFYEKK